MKISTIKLLTAYLILFLSILAPAQTGGDFTITQSVIGGGGQNSTGGAFSLDGTIGQAVAGGALNGSSFAVTSGFWNFTPTAPNAITYEADVDPRGTNGNQTVDAGDIIQMRRFVNRADVPNSATNEFQRADSSPFNPTTGANGDGKIQSDDIVQTIRYANRADTLRSANGPNAPAPSGGHLLAGDKQVTQTDAMASGVYQRRLRVQNAAAGADNQVTVDISVDAVGDEAEYGFTIDYAPSALTSPVVSIGDAGGTRSCNTTTSPGQIFCSVGNFQVDRTGDTAIGEIASGAGQTLVSIRFNVSPTAQANSSTAVRLTDVNVSDDTPPLPASIAALDGAVSIASVPAGVTVSGRVITAQGRGIRNAVVSLTDSSGNVRTAVTAAFGYYSFAGVAAGGKYTITVRAKRFTFSQSTQSLNVNSDAENIDFIGTSPDRL